MTSIQQGIIDFKRVWFNDDPTLLLRTSGSTGVPKTIRVHKKHMVASAHRTCETLGIEAGATTLLCMPVAYIAGRMVCVRAWECGLRLIAVDPSLHPLSALTAPPDFAAMTPAQVYETLQVPREAELLRRIRFLLIGGGAIGVSVAEALQAFEGVWSTYGMTETLSHIALRRLSEREEAYQPLKGVSLQLDERGCLVVTDPIVGVANLVTNDLAELLPNGRFRLKGRADNTICSGGLKWQIEALENLLATLPVPFQITAVPDERLGEAIVLFYARPQNQTFTELSLREACVKLLPRHALPRYYICLSQIPQTPTGKPDRASARRLAKECLKP